MNWPYSVDLTSGYAVIDMEMTGGDPRNSLIIEIAVGVVLPGSSIRTDRVLVNIEGKIPARIQRLTGITDRDLRMGGMQIDDALSWFTQKTLDLPLVGHSIISGDRPHLVRAARMHRETVNAGDYSTLCISECKDLPLRRFVDTAGLYKGHKLGEYPMTGESHQDYVRRVMSISSQGLRTNLKAACEDLSISTSRIRSHRAAADVVQNHKLFEKLLELNPPE